MNDPISVAVFNFAYWFAFIPAHIICGFGAGSRAAWAKANE